MFLRTKFLYAGVLFALLSFGSYFGFSYLFSVDISFEQFSEVGDEVIIKLGPLASEKAVEHNFNISPAVEGHFAWLKDQRELHFIPNEGFEAGRKYTVKIFPGGSLMAQAGSPSAVFTFSPVRFSSGSSYTPAEIYAGKYIDVNLSTMQITLVENGEAVGQYPVAGKGNPWTKPTKEGSFTILTKEPLHWSKLAKLWMPWSMQFSGNYFIHDWPYWPGGALINSTYSNGCIRMYNSDAKKIFDWAEIGMRIVVHSTPQRFAVFSGEVLQDGDLVREQNNDRVYVIKKQGDQLYKRHVWTPDFGKWYAHLSSFWQRIKTVPDGTLGAYIESRWVALSEADHPEESGYIYEINPQNRTRHKMICGKTPLSAQEGPEFCRDAWQSYGWPDEEIFTISRAEFEAYTEGEPMPLAPAIGN
ncbi:MAG: hypothetical protein A2919_01700 [Candidatus Spechtbacteria bacterium RIFCSPLOWO2_01_FULL_43_12]|uniref:L,D-TPase catalytic domain-containing protein n=1 Tax=Candidatus Spechtbacteria bacterium RIFCSPLOWO2_01_FULL_43_12 TaxID=1802162 RepID=A0A1G2HDM6_9BACT|nr:MAG: hypothetical protein A2919_01700 [Candidatus Spechtbacteria bacterium RIFCSPLOWO2_01_FULL_43_12]